MRSSAHSARNCSLLATNARTGVTAVTVAQAGLPSSMLGTPTSPGGETRSRSLPRIVRASSPSTTIHSAWLDFPSWITVVPASTRASSKFRAMDSSSFRDIPAKTGTWPIARTLSVEVRGSPASPISWSVESMKSTGTSSFRRSRASRFIHGKMDFGLDLASTACGRSTATTDASSSGTRPNRMSFVFECSRPRRNRALNFSRSNFALLSISCMTCHGRITTPLSVRALVTSGRTRTSVTGQPFSSAYSRALPTSAASVGSPSVRTTRAPGSMVIVYSLTLVSTSSAGHRLDAFALSTP